MVFKSKRIKLQMIRFFFNISNFYLCVLCSFWHKTPLFEKNLSYKISLEWLNMNCMKCTRNFHKKYVPTKDIPSTLKLNTKNENK